MVVVVGCDGRTTGWAPTEDNHTPLSECPAPKKKEFGQRSNFSDVPDDFVLPPGSIFRGQKYFKKYCAQCHSRNPDNSFHQGGRSAVGPTMFNVYYRASGQLAAGVVREDAANWRVAGIVWTDSAIMNYMKHPQAMLGPGYRANMNFYGLSDFQTRVDIIHYLRTLDWSNRECVEEMFTRQTHPNNWQALEKERVVSIEREKEEAWTAKLAELGRRRSARVEAEENSSQGAD